MGFNRVRDDYPEGVTPLGGFAAAGLPSTTNPTRLTNNNFADEAFRYNPFSNLLTNGNCTAAEACRITRAYTSVYVDARYDITPAWSVNALVEQSVDGANGHRASVGSEYQLQNVGRFYGRYELVNNLLNNYGLGDDTNSSRRFVFGADTPYMKGGNIFQELRVASGGSQGRETVSATGVRNVFNVTEHLVANTSVENQVLLSNAGGIRRAKALAGGLEYTTSPLWRIGGRLEYRISDSQKTWLSSASAVRRLNNDWSILARNLLLSSQGIGAAAGQNQTQDRLQFGLAYRDTGTNKLNAIGRYEHNIDRNNALVNSTNLSNDVIAVSANFRPSAAWTASTSAAFKHQVDKIDGPASTFNGKLISARLMYDVNDRFDVGVLGSHSWGGGAKDGGFGVEVGYRLLTNLWLSGGYIAGRYADSELYSTNNHWSAFYVRLRFKFDENSLANAGWAQ